jgi:peptidase M23-like protein
MRRHRTTARGVFLAVILGIVAGTATAAVPKVPEHIIFPVVGKVQYIDDFGAPRPGGAHQGNDLMAAKKSPAVAAEAGKVKYWTTSSAAGCMLYLYGDSGTTYLYIHLNNDLTMKNDNRGSCVAGVSYAPGLKDGARVTAGQLVGYVGDSGDANGIHPHLHFEVHPKDGAAVDPYPYLRKAQPLMFYAKTNKTVDLSLTGTIISAFGGSLALKTSQIQVGTAKPVAVSRKVVLSLPDDTPDASLLTASRIMLNS